MPYASGKHAFGFCDRTGFRYSLADLVDEYKHGTKTGLKVGRDVADGDHPQNFIGRIPTGDNFSLQHPRPGRTEPEAIRMLSNNPFSILSASVFFWLTIPFLNSSSMCC